VAGGAEPAANANYVAAFRGTGGDGSASLANAAAPDAAANGATPSSVTTAPSGVRDVALELAIDAARSQPVAQL
jgi:hypothetical protein